LRAPVVRLAVVLRVALRAVVRFAVDFLRAPVVRLAVDLRAVVFLRVVAFLRVPVVRFAAVRLRVPVERAVLRRVPVERLRDAVFRAAVDRPVELDLLRAVAMCLLLLGEFGGNNYVAQYACCPGCHSAERPFLLL
jgi:hypothetical protein